MTKTWDLSPVDQSSFDPFEPPGRPVTPVAPINVAPPAIIPLDLLEPGHQLAGQQGSWTGTPTPTYVRQWYRDDTPIVGETGLGYTLIEADVGFMMGLDVTATNSAGSASEEADPVGPVLPSS
jgi:hypothetical protein